METFNFILAWVCVLLLLSLAFLVCVYLQLSGNSYYVVWQSLCIMVFTLHHELSK